MQTIIGIVGCAGEAPAGSALPLLKLNYPTLEYSLVYPLVCGAPSYCSASAATSSRQKAGISGATRPQTT
jgi:hypothetical protein